MRRWIFALVLAGCGSDGAKYDPPPPVAVASCSIVQKRPDIGTARHELWFDSAGVLVQADGFDGSATFEYDDQGRLVRETTPKDTMTWTYEPTRITFASTRYNSTYIYDLDADGHVMRVEDAGEPPIDFTYDSAGHVASSTRPGLQHMYGYDPQGRLTTEVTIPPEDFVESYAYTEGPGHLQIDLTGEFLSTYTYDFDGDNRIVRAAVVTDGVTYGYTYAYSGDSMTAIGDDNRYETDATGMCPVITTTFGPLDVLHIQMTPGVVTLPNPPVDEFASRDYY